MHSAILIIINSIMRMEINFDNLNDLLSTTGTICVDKTLLFPNFILKNKNSL